MLISKSDAIVMALICGANLKYPKSDFATIKWEQITELYSFLYNFSFSDVTRLDGYNPLTGLPITVIFNETSLGHSKVMNWNPLMRKWMYSENAGLTWNPVEFMDYIEEVDCLMSEPRYDGIVSE